MPWPLAIVIAFICGSIPFGLLIARARGIDIREHGSRNIGATNVGRVLGRSLGILCFVLDALKGAAPVALAGVLNGLWGKGPEALAAHDQWLWFATAIAALMGHLFPPWLRFRGGKGVATGFGALAAIWPTLTVAAFVALALWIVLVAITRYISLSSIVAALSVPATVAAWSMARAGSAPDGLRSAAPWIVGTTLLAGLVIVRHRANIARLMRGEELRVGRRSAAPGGDR